MRSISAREIEGCRILFLGAVLGWLAVGTAAAAPYGYSLSDGDLLRVDLATGAAQVLGPTGLGGSAEALTFGPGDRLYGFGRIGGEPALRRIDPATGTGEPIAPEPYPVDGLGLAPTGDGMLWMTDAQDLYRIDPETGSATFRVTLAETVPDLAAYGGELYGFSLDGGFHRIDTATGALQPLFAFDEPPLIVTGASFDGHGVLWFLAVPQGGVPETVPLTAYRVTDLDAGNYEVTFDVSVGFTDTRFDMRPLAMPTTLTAVDVPASDLPAMVVLSLGVLGSGLFALRRRRRRRAIG